MFGRMTLFATGTVTEGNHASARYTFDSQFPAFPLMWPRSEVMSTSPSLPLGRWMTTSGNDAPPIDAEYCGVHSSFVPSSSVSARSPLPAASMRT